MKATDMSASAPYSLVTAAEYDLMVSPEVCIKLTDDGLIFKMNGAVKVSSDGIADILEKSEGKLRELLEVITAAKAES